MDDADLPEFRRRLLAWYDASARDLPWRGQGRTPYRVLVSEAMLQQTQVKAATPYFERFMAELPTLESLAAANEQTVLRLWQGLGYYSRARNLRRAAQMIVSEHNGIVPKTVDDLLKLPGVGRYSAGAIASIAHGTPAPILDGNVVRVLCRLDKIEGDPRSTPVQKRLWRRADEVLDRGRPGDFNSALMELGATVCIPREPHCLICPVASCCAAKAAGVQGRIPPPKKATATPLSERDVFRIRNGRGEWLVEQRPAKGRWAGMWQFVTRPRGEPPPVQVAGLAEAGVVTHGLTHRRYHFRVLDGSTDAAAPPDTRWASDAQLDALPMSKPQLAARALPRSDDTAAR